MNVQSILARKKDSEVVTTGPYGGIQIAAHLMRARNIGAVVVTEGNEIVGMLFARDIVDAFSRQGSKLSDLSVSDVMRRHVISVTPQDTIKHVMMLMTRHRATHMPVLEAGRLVGIVSIGDIVKHRQEELETETNVLRDLYIAMH